MKKISQIVISALIICLIPFSMVVGQEKRNEQKIKIVIDDGSGKKVILDTLLKNVTLTDSIRLKDGEIIYLGDDINRDQEGHKNISITVSSDGKEKKKEVKEITIVSSDPGSSIDSNNTDKIYVHADSNASEGISGGNHKIMTISDDNGRKSVKKVIIVHDGKDIEKEEGDTFENKVETDRRDSDVEMTKYVISKNGMVISIEGDDYGKVKELVEMIENKMDAEKDKSGKNDIIKDDTGKTGKKR
jgi:hypothetical protein